MSGEPTVEQLKRRMESIAVAPFDGIGFRSTTPEYATEIDLITGVGSERYGGRWNPIGVAAVYLSQSPGTAMAETLAHNVYFAIPIEDAMPRTFVSIAVSLQSTLDIEKGTIRQRLRISKERILGVDWRREMSAGRQPITQRIGQAAFEIGLEAILVPSNADPHGSNLVVFPDNLEPGSFIQTQNPHRL